MLLLLKLPRGFLSQIAQSLSIFRKHIHYTSKATEAVAVAVATAQYAQNVINLSIQINLNSNKLRNGIVNSQVNTEFSMKINTQMAIKIQTILYVMSKRVRARTLAQARV